MFTTISNSLLGPLKGQYIKPAAESKEGSATTAAKKNDTASISEAAKLLSANNVDFNNSYAEITRSTLDFSLAFNTRTEESLSASGYYKMQEERLNLSMSYEFERTVIQDGQTINKRFRLNLSINASKMKKFSLNPRREKEDIVNFIRRVVDKVMEIADDDDRKLLGLNLDEEDVAELIAMGEDEIGQKLYEVLLMAVAVAQMKDMMEDNEDAEGVVLNPKREIREYIEKIKERAEEFGLNISIEEISSEVVSDAEKPETPETESESAETAETETAKTSE